MQKGTIGQVLDYFLDPEHGWMFGRDIQQALVEFMGNSMQISEEASGYFTEWFLFDYSFRNGKTPLQYFMQENPLKLSEKDILLYTELNKTQHHDFFEVLSIIQDKTLMLRSVRDGRTYEASERSTTNGPQIGDVLVCRIGKIDEVWELVSNNALTLPNPSKKDLRRMQEQFPILNPKIVYHEIIEPEMIDPVNFSMEQLQEGAALISGAEGDMPDDGFDDCAVCQLMRKAKKEGRQPSQVELESAMREANQKK